MTFNIWKIFLASIETISYLHLVPHIITKNDKQR